MTTTTNKVSGYASLTAIEGLLTEFCMTPGSNVEIPVKIIPIIAARLCSALVKIEREDYTFQVKPTKDAEPYMVTDSQFKLIKYAQGGKGPEMNITDSDPKRHMQDDYRTTGITGLMCRIFEIVGPMVGAPVTYWCWTDKHPGTVVKVSPSGKTIWIREDRAHRTDKNGQSESQTYTYEREPLPAVDGSLGMEFRLGRGKKNAGQWVGNGYKAAVGHRRKYDDPSF